MTVVMQHWYDKLEVGETGFAVTLNFGDQPEPLYIPYDAIKTFVDPSVEFGLRFEPTEGAPDTGVSVVGSDEPEDTPAPEPDVSDIDEDSDPPKVDADIVSLDSFRK